MGTPHRTFLADVLALAGEEPDAIRDEARVALGDLLDGFVLTLLIAVAIGTIYFAIRLVKDSGTSPGDEICVMPPRRFPPPWSAEGVTPAGASIAI
jgi:hypothetical protein